MEVVTFDGEKPIKSNGKTRLDAMIPSDPLTPLTIPSINTKVNPYSHATLWLFHINLRQRLAVEKTKRKGENGFLLIHIHIFFS